MREQSAFTDPEFRCERANRQSLQAFDGGNRNGPAQDGLACLHTPESLDFWSSPAHSHRSHNSTTVRITSEKETTNPHPAIEARFIRCATGCCQGCLTWVTKMLE